MQGSWTVSVKSKELGSTPQRFIISGAATGNGTYTATNATPPVHVNGAAWAIDVQHDPGSGFVDSFMEITFPANNGVNYSFNIDANDDEIDPVFDDLILTCTTPVTQNDFILFGNVSWYSGCIFTPCRPFPSVVIDSEASLQAALLRPTFRKVIETLYPERVYPKPVGPGPDPGPFRPFLLPVEDNPIVPQEQVKVFADTSAVSEGAATSALAVNSAAAAASQIVALSAPSARSAVSLSAIDVAGLFNINRGCQSGVLADYLLRFEDYTPTAAEAAGGPYTGNGVRTVLGVTTTDRRGNYIFRFTLPCRFIIFDPRIPIHIPFPRCHVTLPNVIVQVLDGTAPSGVLYETTPFFNTPEFAQINVCVPKGVVTLPPGCTTGQIIQSIGNITVGPLVGTTRTTSNTSLDASGQITNSGALGPQVTCAAWAGSLYFYACLDNPNIVSYTIRYGSSFATANQFVNEDYSPYRVVPAPVYVAPQSVGPTNRSLETETGVFSTVPSYFNAETDTSTPWLDRWKVLKMVLTSSLYQQALGGAGSIVFRIQGYDVGGNLLADDNITLYVDNNFVDQFIDPNLILITTVGPQTQGNCALFTLPAGGSDAGDPIQVSFRANQYEGFMASYTLGMDKGSTGGFAITSSSPISPAQEIGGCGYTGTLAESGYNLVTGELTVQVAPASGHWLDPGQVFCAFSIDLSSSVRVTDGQSVFGPFNSTPVLIGIQQG
jgi:hypothetical protein